MKDPYRYENGEPANDPAALEADERELSEAAVNGLTDDEYAQLFEHCPRLWANKIRAVLASSQTDLQGWVDELRDVAETAYSLHWGPDWKRDLVRASDEDAREEDRGD